MSDQTRPLQKPTLIADLMSDSEAGFGRVLLRARALERLSRKVQPLLDEQLAAHCRMVNVRQKTMVFGCTSSACATRLRMIGPDLVRRLHDAGFEEIEKIEVRMMTGD